MAMFIRIWHTLVMTLVVPSLGMEAYLCSWPAAELVQLRCDRSDCPYLSIDRITVGRLKGAAVDCPDLNANATARKPIAECNYVLPSFHNFLGMVKLNCAKKSICDVSANNWNFAEAGQCGREYVEASTTNMRNWMNVSYSCVSDIPGVVCPNQQSEDSEIVPSIVITPTTSPLKKRAEKSTPDSSKHEEPKENNLNQIVTLVIPILATLFFLALLLIIGTMMYRHGICKTRSWRKPVATPRGTDRKPDLKCNIILENSKNQFRLDAAKLMQLERRLGIHPERVSNDYFHETEVKSKSLPRTDQPSLTKPRFHARRRPNSESLDPESALQNQEVYFSDSSITTCTSDEIDANGHPKSRRRPLPPLAMPVVKHSEVYFTETETESEAPNPKRPYIPKVDSIPRVHCDRKADRRAATQLTENSQSNERLSLGKHDPKKSLHSKRPIARPRTLKPLGGEVYDNLFTCGSAPSTLEQTGHSRISSPEKHKTHSGGRPSNVMHRSAQELNKL